MGGNVDFRSIADGKLLKQWRLPGVVIFGFAFSPGGKSLAIAYGDSSAAIANVATGKITPLPEGVKGVTDTVFTPDGRKIVSSWRDGYVLVWETASGRMISAFKAHEKTINLIAISPDGKLLATASDDRFVKLWDMETGKLVRRIGPHAQGVVRAIFLSGGKVLATHDTAPRYFDMASGKQILGYSGSYTLRNRLSDRNSRTGMRVSGSANEISLSDRNGKPLAVLVRLGNGAWVTVAAGGSRFVASRDAATYLRVRNPGSLRTMPLTPEFRRKYDRPGGLNLLK